MKRKTLATIAIVTLLLVLMIWSFGSSAANNHEGTPEQNPSAPAPSSTVFQDADEQEPDADLGKLGSRGPPCGYRPGYCLRYQYHGGGDDCQSQYEDGFTHGRGCLQRLQDVCLGPPGASVMER